MKAILIFFLIFVFFPGHTQESTECACCQHVYRQFDFWVGDWVVKSKESKILGYNTLTKREEGCMISEYWRSKRGGTGRSTNFFDSSDSTWNQLWISSSGHILELKGKLINGSMVLKSAVKSNEKGSYRDRITWTPHADGTILQKWDLLTPEGQVLRTAFEGVYYPKE